MGLLGTKLILAPLGMPNFVWSLVIQYRKFLDENSTPTPKMHRKLTEHAKFCMQNNQLPTQTTVKS